MSVRSVSTVPALAATTDPDGVPQASVDRWIEEQAELEARRASLKSHGVYTPDTLAEVVKRQNRQVYLVEGLIRPKTINVLVGDSGLGKTPLGIQLGVCVAGGRPFLQRASQQGRVLYCDAESDPSTFQDTISAISHFLGLPETPMDFHVWSPNWDSQSAGSDVFRSWSEKLITRVHIVKPAIVIIDPLRMFWPKAETANDEAAEVIRELRGLSRETGCAWLITHHRRKVNHQQHGVVTLEENANAWFQEAAGAHAIVNHSDARIGVVAHSGQADLLMGGFVRGTGPFVPLDLARATDDDGSPVGYRLLVGIEHLSPDDRLVFDRLSIRFRFKDVGVAVGGTSDSNANRILKKCMSLGLVIKEGKEYMKVTPYVECMERLECPEIDTPSTPQAPSPSRPVGPHRALTGS